MRKFITSLTIGIMVITSVSFGYTKIYDMNSKEVPVSSGVTYQNIKRLTTGGWLNINIIKADLTNEYVKIDMLTPPEGIYNPATVKEQAISANAVAAVNADFFSWVNGKNNTVPVGFGMKDGVVTSSMYYKNAEKDIITTFSLNSSNLPFYNYVRSEKITVTNSKGESLEIADINKASSDYLKPVIFNSYWSKISNGNSAFSDMTEFVIEDDRVKEIRESKDSVTIPENGYVICVRLDEADNLKHLFEEGDKITLDVKTDADMSGMITALSGGTMLVSNGNTLEKSFTHDIPGYQPRTAVGTSKDDKTLYMVTVDGRGISKGVTQNELAYLMQEIGCYNAINFDGGGSTMMTGRLPGEENLTVLNNPTENRKVADALGVISTAPKSSTVGGLIIDSTNSTIFENHETKLTVKGYDKNINPITIDSDDIKWSVTGVKGTVKNEIFKPTSSGDAILKATYKGVSETITVKVLGEIGEISLGERNITLAEGEEYILPVKVKDVMGHSADYDTKDLTFLASNKNLEIDNTGKIFAKKIGSTLVTVQAKNGIKSFVKVNIAGEIEEQLNDFEELDVSFKGYPSDDVTGKVRLSSTSHSGDKSLQLSYDLTETGKTRAAYAVFDEPVKIDSTSVKLKFWALTKSARKDLLLKVQIEDATGATKLVEVKNGLTSTKWTEYEVALNNILLPAKLDRIYVAQVEGAKGIDSSIYVDDLMVIKKGSAGESEIVLPNDVGAIDLSERSEELKENGFKFMVYGDANYSNTLYDIIRKRNIEKIGEDVSFAILGSGDIESVSEKTVLNGNYSFYEKGSTAVIKLASSGNGLLSAYPEQWNWLIGKLNNTKAKNIIILMEKSLRDSFNDMQEKALFEQIITEYKEKNNANIIFILPRDMYGFTMNEGYKTIFYDVTNYDSIREKVYNDKYLMFTVNGDSVTYEILTVS